MQIAEIKPNVFACLTANQTANAGFLITEPGVVVVDTLNSPARGRELAGALRAYTNKPFLFVVNTHHHSDHTFGNQAFGALVIAHCRLAAELAAAFARDLSPEAVAAWIADHPEDRWLADELEVIYPNVIFEQRLVLDLPPLHIVVRHLGGHTPDSSIVDLPGQGVLFAGDLVFEGRVPFLGQAHLGKTIRALRAIESLGERTIVPGHGALCDTAYVARTRAYLEDLRAVVADLIARGWSKSEVLGSDELPSWWTDDRPEVLRVNIERFYDQLSEAALNQ